MHHNPASEYDTELMMSLPKRWSASKFVAAAAWALVAVVAGMPSVDAMFSSTSDVVQVRDVSFRSSSSGSSRKVRVQTA